MSDRIADELIAPPRLPGQLTMAELISGAKTAGNVAYDVGVQPFVDIGNAVGGVATQGLGAPELGAGVMGAMGLMSPGARSARGFAVNVSKPNAEGRVKFGVEGGGYLSAKVGDGRLRVEDVQVPPSMGGQGRGLSLYQNAIDYAQQRGLTFASDAQVSADALRVYDALRRRGHEVVQSPGAMPTPGPGGLHSVGGDSPVFEILKRR